MKRYSEIQWPWIGLAIPLILLGGDLLFQWFGANPALTQTGHRMLIATIGSVSLALLLLPRRRMAYFLGALVCAGLMGWALWLQYGLGLDPCPLCSLQRLTVITLGVIFLIAGIHNPRRGGAIFYALLTLAVGAFGIVTAARHVWIQALPKGEVPSCGMGLNYMLETLPLTDVLSKVFKGSGECAETAWTFLGLAIPSWTFVFFVAMIVSAFTLARRD
jgi:disulfide bond formation protein DsbB